MLSRVGILKGHHLKSLVQPKYVTASTSCTPCPGENKNEPQITRPVRQEPGKVRMGFIPEEWFTFFYKKTGVTGPYTFGVALSTYLVSKEIYVLEHEFYNGLSIAILCIVGVKKLGPKIAAYLDKEVDEYEAELSSCRRSEQEGLAASIKNEKHNQWSAEGQLMLTNAKRENVLLQLEAEYRQRLMTAYDQVKRYLDYQLQREAAERRVAQKNLVNWVVKQVMGSITSEQEKQNIDKCIADLGVLAKA